jgi:hypothetical protein
MEAAIVRRARNRGLMVWIHDFYDYDETIDGFHDDFGVLL